MADHPKPKYEVGEYLTIYCGRDENCCFTVKAREWRDEQWHGVHHIKAGWWYDTGSYGWRGENTICTEAHARFYA